MGTYSNGKPIAISIPHSSCPIPMGVNLFECGNRFEWEPIRMGNLFEWGTYSMGKPIRMGKPSQWGHLFEWKHI